MGFFKGQSSQEYLSNYTIAAVVIVIVIAALSYLGVWRIILGESPPICIFQKGLDCGSFYIKGGDNMASMKLYNRFEDAISISGVICSAEPINPATALPYSRSWNDPATDRPTVHGTILNSANPLNPPTILMGEEFDVNVYCYTEQGNGIGTLGPQERYKGIVFIRYRLNSSPAMFVHTIQGNLQGNPN